MRSPPAYNGILLYRKMMLNCRANYNQPGSLHCAKDQQILLARLYLCHCTQCYVSSNQDMCKIDNTAVWCRMDVSLQLVQNLFCSAGGPLQTIIVAYMHTYTHKLITYTDTRLVIIKQLKVTCSISDS